jgi:hypothetical protein
MANLLSVPHTFITIFNLILLTFASEAYNNRWFIASIENIWCGHVPYRIEWLLMQSTATAGSCLAS